MVIQIQKASERVKYRKLRNNEILKKELLIYSQVEEFIERILHSEPSKKKLHIGLYWPLKGEVNLTNLKKTFQVPFSLPCCDKDGKLVYREWNKKPLRKDYCGIPSPIEELLIKPADMGIIFVPALAIDYRGYRLGYGGGYFDRLRKDSSWKKILTYVVIPKVCISETPLPIDSWDIPFSGWITENGKHEITKRNY